MSKRTLAQLKEQYDFVTHYNDMAPFPLYDTEYVDKLKERIMEIENSRDNYDELPVVACKNCKSLHIVVDEVDNSLCMRCNSINEIVEFANIFEYKKEKNIWNED